MTAAVLEIHSLRTLPPSLLNRDDQGLPKTAVFGGVTRARHSSQALKRAMRRHFREYGLVPDENLSDRTRTLTGLLTDALIARGHAQDDAATLSANVAWGMGLLNTKPENAQRRLTNVLLFISAQEVAAIADAVHANAAELRKDALPAADIWPDLDPDADAGPSAEAASKAKRKAACPKTIQTFAKPLLARLDCDHAVDIALFGRFLAEEPAAKVDGAASVAHAIGVTEGNMDLDYYTAVDDLAGESGFLSTTYLTAPTLYSYASVDLRQLRDSLDGDEKLAELALRAFTTAFLLASPTGKRTSTAPYTRPDLALATLRSGQPMSLANAYRKPVRASRDTDLLLLATDALTLHWENLERTYGHDDLIGAWNLYTGDYTDLARPLPGDPVNASQLAERAAARAVLHLA